MFGQVSANYLRLHWSTKPSPNGEMPACETLSPALCRLRRPLVAALLPSRPPRRDRPLTGQCRRRARREHAVADTGQHRETGLYGTRRIPPLPASSGGQGSPQPATAILRRRHPRDAVEAGSVKSQASIAAPIPSYSFTFVSTGARLTCCRSSSATRHGPRLHSLEAATDSLRKGTLPAPSSERINEFGEDDDQTIHCAFSSGDPRADGRMC